MINILIKTFKVAFFWDQIPVRDQTHNLSCSFELHQAAYAIQKQCDRKYLSDLFLILKILNRAAFWPKKQGIHGSGEGRQTGNHQRSRQELHIWQNPALHQSQPAAKIPMEALLMSQPFLQPLWPHYSLWPDNFYLSCLTSLKSMSASFIVG